jgi:pectate lyase
VFRPVLTALAGALAVSALACGDAKLYPYVRIKPPDNCSGTDVMLGFAAVASSGTDGGAGAGPTTGGGDLPAVPVNRIEDLLTELHRPEPRVILLDGMLTAPDTIKVTPDKDVRGGNKTLIGVGVNSGLTGAGLDLGYSDNVIVRNLKIAKVSVGEGDAITILDSHHIWIDHCDLSSDREDTTAGYDGLVDITHGSSFVTVSWTLFHDHKDTSLVGHTPNPDPMQQAEDEGLSVTYHHNGFFKVNSGPRVRWGTAHVANNHFDDVTSFGIVSDSAAIVFVDSNMFEDNVNTMNAVTTSYGDPIPGTMLESGDRFPSGFRLDIMRPTVAPPPLPYSYNADMPATVSAIVPYCAGTGKLGF